MIIKFSAIPMSVCATLLYLMGIQNPTDNLFLLISDSKAVAMLRLILVVALIGISVKRRFVYRESKFIYAIAGTFFAAFGVAGLFVDSLQYQLFDIIRPLDYLFFLQVGIMFVLSCVIYGYSYRRLAVDLRPWLNKLNAGITKIRLVLPKLPYPEAQET